MPPSAFYRVCLLDRVGNPITAEVFEASDDEAAKRLALTLLGRNLRYTDVELWCGGRRVFGSPEPTKNLVT